MAAGLTREKEEFGHVRSQFPGQQGEGQEFPLPGGHLDLFAVPVKGRQLDDDDLQLLRVAAQAGQARLESGYVSEMIGPPEVDHQLVALGVLEPVIGEVGGQVGVAAVGLDQDPVLVVSIGHRLQKECPLRFIDEPRFFKAFQRLPDLPARGDFLLAPVGVEDHAERGQVGTDFLQYFRTGPVTEEFARFQFQTFPAFGHQAAGQVNQVFTLVTVFRQGPGISQQVQDAHPQ
ncbi:MAG: hypothetical protein BWY73_01470 [candidate division TA06 bacterium ADurb.Bin417]|uniref:Uncharacterized protein n=1 Tax=candidate division TA06 bacterium ADurb.Bin417 TaxID=1852828 RepID=A0A1V5M8Q6_UNCT6|nr:MAG: hypothetical protein BWY73_01470 [candidate division TA06 bacterium ADurb.Bin417]